MGPMRPALPTSSRHLPHCSTTQNRSAGVNLRVRQGCGGQARARLSQSEDRRPGQVNRGHACTAQSSRAKCARFAGSVVAQPDCMKPHNLFSVGVLILALAIPGTASAQRGSGQFRGGSGMRGAGRPVGTVGRSVMRPTVVVPRVIVRQPIVTGFARPHHFGRPRDFGRIGFGSTPVRSGFGRHGVRTGFERPPFGTGFVAPSHRVAVPFATGRGHAFRSKGFHTFRRGHVFGGPVVVGYPWWPYSYAYPNGYPYQVPASTHQRAATPNRRSLVRAKSTGRLGCRPASQRTGLTSRISQALRAG